MTTTSAVAGTRVETTPLRREITRPMLTVFVIADVLGAGIYALVGEVAGKVGGAIWTSFLLAGVLAAFTAAAIGAEDRSSHPASEASRDQPHHPTPLPQ